MKANEAPKKLYLLPNGLISYCRSTDEDVEYIRTDAFVEKVCEFLNKTCRGFILTEKDIEDFRKAIEKGE